MDVTHIIREQVVSAVKKLYDATLSTDSILLNPTRKEFEGDYTVVVFPFTKAARKKPEAIGEELGNYLTEQVDEISGFNVIKGFLNLTISDHFWGKYLLSIAKNPDFCKHPATGKKIIVEFSSPNTNKPLHLGHIRNILLGWSCSKILEANGNTVVKTQIVNDRGIHICKSMVAWERFANGETPESSGLKGDHFVGKYYVAFNNEEKKQAEGLEEGQETEIMTATRAMLKKWEANDPEVKALWSKMNGWVYSGFEQTYKSLGVHFDVNYYESETYLLGKGIIDKGLEDGIFYKKEDGSVWIDLEDAKLDHKLVLRSDGTSVYMTQDLGTARKRNEDHQMQGMTYVVGDEQNYHFKVLFEILKRLGEPYAENLHHLSYGMVGLPDGKMKSREGTVVDADDLIAEVIGEVEKDSKERGEIEGAPEAERREIFRMVGLGALKYQMLKVDPKKGMIFNPAESVALQGDTGPYVQFAYVRMQGILRKLEKGDNNADPAKYTSLHPHEKNLLLFIQQYPETLARAGANFDPSEIANYVFELASYFHKFLHDVKVLKAESEEAKAFRLELSKMVGRVLEAAFDLLGIEMPERM